ncbi:MAG TPA: 7-carboxy-7-deazaguanine synthase QueE [Bryobacteraceae bacterium]|nr:7-carboxy-7-deazaguanine synthase QueE [Bryobacteraceae bacterium]
MKISEIFYSIQGEGSLVGIPSVFIRTSGCNLRCVWCDTPYTSWSPEGEELAVETLLQRVVGYGASHVVVTGGEPMIAPQIVALSERLRAAGLHITIETAGTVYAPVACDLMSISPKLTNSIPREREGGRWAAQHDRMRLQPAILRRLTTEYPFQFKFVVAAPEDLTEIQALCSECAVRPSDVILMPEGIRSDVLHERALWLAEVCKETGFRFSPRLHVDLWGDRRGV